VTPDAPDRAVPQAVPGAVPQAVPGAAPQSVPGAVPTLDHAVSPAVTDEDRNRYGMLLDHAAERGLLTPTEYRARLAQVAEATSTDELQRIVTELPAFTTAPTSGPTTAGTATRAPADPAALDGALWANLTPATSRGRSRSSNPWLMLAMVIVVVLVAVVALALMAAHVAHTHHTGSLPAVGALVSRLRL